MNKFINNMYDFSTKGGTNNNSSSLQNNYYKEDINYKNNSKIRSDSLNYKTKSTSKSKNKYKVTYSNSILNNDINSNINKNLENKNVLIINKKINNSIGNIKEINYYSNKKKSKINNIKSHNFYDKKINEILNSDNYNNKNNNKKNNNNINISIENNNLNLTNKSIIHNISKNNLSKSKSKSKNIKNIKNISSKKKGIKIIYAKYPDKRPSLPIVNKNKYNNKNINNKWPKKYEKENNSKNKLSFIQNKTKNNNNNLISSNYYTNNTYTNNNNLNKHNLIPKNRNKSKNQIKEIKKCQSQSYFKYKVNMNDDINTSNYKYKYNSRMKNKSKNDLSYKGIIMNKKNIIKNKIMNSSSHNYSSSKKNPIVCINYKNNYINNYNINKINNNNYNYFMNNLSDEYNKDPLFMQIKNLWNKLRVTHSYQEMFITLTKHIENNEKKKQIFLNEISNLSLILNNLNKLNEDIQSRNTIINKIKQFNNYNNLEEIKKLLNSLRMISIDIVYDYISFIKEISYDVLKNKFNLENIKNFNRNYLNNMKNDTNFLYFHNYLNKIFYLNKNDPFLIYPSHKNTKNNNNFLILPLNEETLKKINECEYFLLTEKICEYSMCNNKANINSLLFNDQDNIINNLINNDTINISNIENNNNNIINSYSTIKNKDNSSPFSTPINKKEDIETQKINKYEKFCYNNINNSDSNNNNNKNNEEIKYKDSNSSNNNLISQINTNKSNNDNDNDNDNISELNNNISKNTKDINSSPIPVNNDILNINNNNIIIPFIPKNYSSLSSLYTSYLSTVPENIKQSFNINDDIFYYANIGIYPKIILFRNNSNSNIKGICTIAFNQNINSTMNLNKKILTITSISCSKDGQISEILLNLIEFCKNEEIIYDSIEVNLYYIKKEDTNFVLDEELEKQIKSKAKFKWVRLENDGEKRKIKYHYIPNNIITNKENSIFNNLNINNLDMNCNKCSIYLNNYVLIKYNQEKGINDISMIEHSKLFFIINLLNKYYLLNENNNNIEKDIENILINLKGLKLKKVVRLLSEYNNTLLTNISDFKNDYSCSDNYNEDLLNNFVNIIEKISNDNENNNLENNICLNINNICTNFSNIRKIDLDGYEYNIISMNDFIIEVFNISDNNTNNEVIYFTKSEIENISFIFYEKNEENKNDINYIKLLFNKILKKILIKDSEEPINSFKKICIPSFSYQRKIIEEKNENDILNIIEYDLLDCNESFDFCIENIPNYNTKFSFPFDENIFNNKEIKIIKNSFVVAILNPDLVLDYHLPSMNIYYINKECWIKSNKE